MWSKLILFDSSRNEIYIPFGMKGVYDVQLFISLPFSVWVNYAFITIGLRNIFLGQAVVNRRQNYLLPCWFTLFVFHINIFACSCSKYLLWTYDGIDSPPLQDNIGYLSVSDF